MMSNVVIHPDIEPGVIDNAMLTRCVLQQGPTEEAGRLFAEEGVHLEEVTGIRLEFQNILRIDHLWMLTSLTRLTLSHNLIERIENIHSLTGLIELDLSFNKIEVIENLETLVNLEVLSLFHNKIRKLENLDALERLLIFSIGDNLIEDYKERSLQAAYLRRFRFLRSVSFKGNLCCDDPMALIFLKAALWRVTYLDYKKVTDEEREDSAAFFRALLRRLDEADEKSEKERIAREEYNARVTFFAQSFVEYLSGPEHFEAMFAADADGSLCLQAGGELLDFYSQYKLQYVETMSDLVTFAQEQYGVREREVNTFQEVVKNALEASVSRSKAFVDEYNQKKQPLREQLQRLTLEVTAKASSVEDIEPRLVELVEGFNDLLYDLWKKLMHEEMTLYEQCEESRVQFAVNLTELVTKLMERSRNAFGLWREFECVWTVRAGEALGKLLGNARLLLPGDAGAGADLLEMLSERDTMMNTVAASTDNHARFIDAREDLLICRANSWKDDLISNTNNDEVKRNRDRILEINYFVDNQREEWAELQMGLADPPPDADTAALLGDDF